MAQIKAKWCLAAAALVAAALSGCHDDHPGSSSNPPPPSGPTMVVFSAFAKNVFSNPADSVPINLDGLVFTFDVDDDPTAFDGLLM
jgi:hypothetical protein